MHDATLPAPWSGWRQSILPGDASARRFARITGPDGQTAIVMVTPPSETDSQTAFVSMANVLRENGLMAPHVLHADGNRLILSDLGQPDMAQALVQDSSQAKTLYAVAVDVLLRLHTITPPSNLTTLSPERGGDMVRITADHYCAQPEIADELASATTNAMDALDLQPTTLALRDFHAENLIWRPGRSGTDQFGLVDFQDAFVAPAGYDLVSLLRDARRDVNDDIYDAMVMRFCDGTKGDEAIFRAQMACLGIQRNLRILGVFARLARDLGKTRYIAMMPRVYRHIQADLSHPAMTNMGAVINAHIPPPETAMKNWGHA